MGFDQCLTSPLWMGAMQSPAAQTLALDSAYTHNSAGDAYGIRFVAPASGSLTDVYVFVTAKTGSPGNLTCELRNYSSGTASRPGTTAHATQTAAAPASGGKWVRFTFASPYSVTANTLYWIVIGDAAGSGSDFCTVQTASPLTNAEAGQTVFSPFTSAAGFSTNGTNIASYQMPTLCMKIGSKAYGVPYTTTGSYASSTRKRGWRIEGFTGPVKLRGTWMNSVSNCNGTVIFVGSAAPGSTPDLSVGADPNGSSWFGPYSCAAATNYRVCITFSSSSAGQGYYQIEDYSAFADVQACAFANGGIYSTIDDGAGGWTDEKDKLPKGYLVVADLVAPAPGSVGIIG